MARKKAEEVEIDLDPNAQIIKEHGDVILSIDQFFAKPQEFVSVSPAFDWATGGGIPLGSWVVINAPPKKGKTSIILQLMANAQHQHGMKAVMVPTEGRAKQRDISNIHNLIKTPDKFEFLYSTKDNILSAEKQLEILNTKLHTEERLIVFIDSISSFMEEARQVEYGKATRGGLGQVLKTFCDSNTHVVPLREHIIVGVTHTVANTGNGMATKYEKMPSAFGYQHDVKLKWIWDKQEEWMCGDEQIGIRPKWKVETHAGRGAPNREFSSRFLFNYGISHEAEVMDYAIELSIIKKAGAWMKYVGDDGEILLQAQGWEGFFEALCKEENRSIYEQIYAKVKEEL